MLLLNKKTVADIVSGSLGMQYSPEEGTIISYQTTEIDYIHSGSDIIEMISERIETLLYDKLRNMGFEQEPASNLIEKISDHICYNDRLSEDIDESLRNAMHKESIVDDPTVIVKIEDFPAHVNAIEDTEVKAVLLGVIPMLKNAEKHAIDNYNAEQAQRKN